MLDFGSGKGILSYDTVRLEKNSTEIPDQPFLRMIQNDDRSTKSHGVAVSYRQGLAFSQLPEQYPTLVENLKRQGLIEHAVFAFHLDSDMGSHNQASLLTFGSLDWEKYALSQPKYLRVVTKQLGLWGVRLSGFKVKETLISEPLFALIISWASGLEIPYAAYSLYSSTICKLVDCDPFEQDIVFNCPNNEEQRLPDITFLLESHEFSVPYNFYIRKHDGKCESAITFGNFDYYVLGIPFMRAYYSIFDMESEQIGFARSVNYPSPPSTSSTLYWIYGGAFTLLLICVAVVAFIYCRPTPTPRLDPIIKPLIPRDF